VEQELGALEEEPFGYLPEPLLIELLRERLEHPEAGAGCVFDQLQSPLYQNELIGLKVIMTVLRE